MKPVWKEKPEIVYTSIERMKKHFQELGDFQSVRDLTYIENFITSSVLLAEFARSICNEIAFLNKKATYARMTDVVHELCWITARAMGMATYETSFNFQKSIQNIYDWVVERYGD